jgi:hypothetical protein
MSERTTHWAGCWEDPGHAECATANITKLERDLAAAISDLAESDSIRDRLAHILADTAVALKGPNLPLTLHSWHDLAEVATTIKLASDIGEELLAQEREAHAAAIERAERTCTWTQDDEGNWNTSCDQIHILIDGTPAENGMRYCCYCGGMMP